MVDESGLDLSPRPNRVKALAGGILIAAALVLAGLAVWHDHHSLSIGLHRLPVVSLAVSAVCAYGFVASTFLEWRSVLAGFGVELGRPESARVYFVGQLGKYLPGSIWPVVAQMELARRHGIARKIMGMGWILAVVLSVAIGGVLACALLPFDSASALRTYWWLFPIAVALVVGLQPRIFMPVVNVALRRLHREQLTDTLSLPDLLKASGWTLVGWMFLGAHVYALVDGLGVTGEHAAVASIAAGCLAISVGILLIPVPAGAGVREVAFVLALAPVLDHASGLLVALLSRLILIGADVTLAVVFARWGRSPHPAPQILS